MPVLVAIHSSFVSTSADKASLVMTMDGTAEPDPINLDPLPTCLQKGTPSSGLRIREDTEHVFSAS